MRIGSPARRLKPLMGGLAGLALLVGLPVLALGQHYVVSDQAPCGPMHGGFSGPMPMGAGGTSPPVGYDLMNDVGIEGPLVDQRGPYYFDIRAEAVYLSRTETFEDDITFSRIGSGPDPDPDPTAQFLRSSQLDYDTEVGFRVMGRYDVCPLAVLEFGYMGIFEYESRAELFDPESQIFSLFSRPAPGQGNFGTDPGPPEADPGVDVIGGPMPQTERSTLHTISIESELQSAEISYRRYWVGWMPRVSGTLLAGFRYTRLREDFHFHTEAPVRIEVGGPGVDPAASFDYLVRADNDLAGAQVGGDIWIGLSQGLRLGFEGKAGLFNNHYTLDNILRADPDVVFDNGDVRPFSTLLTEGESFRHNQPAFISEASVDLVADILPSWSVRVGYEVLFINSIVLSGENFNQVSPFGNQGVRVPFLNDQGNALYHGAHAGIEFIW